MGGDGDGAGQKRPNQNKGGGADKKRQKKQYIGGRGRGQYKDKGALGLHTAGFDRLRAAAVKGVLVSCDVRAEPMCTTECVMALTEMAETRYPKLFEEDAASADVGEVDVEKAIAKEAEKEKEEGHFSFIRTDVKGLIFVELRTAEMCPKDLTEDYIKKVSEAGQAKTKYAVRMTPVLATCYANTESICKAIQPLLDKFLGANSASCTYSIIFKKRSNTDIDRMDVINKVAELVDKKHIVELNTPDKCILIDVLMNACLIGIVDEYTKMKKFNIHELTGQGQHQRNKSKGSAPFEGGRVGSNKGKGALAKKEGGEAQSKDAEKEGSGSEDGADEGEAAPSGDAKEGEEGKGGDGEKNDAEA